MSMGLGALVVAIGYSLNLTPDPPLLPKSPFAEVVSDNQHRGHDNDQTDANKNSGRRRGAHICELGFY
jgi:hypothetical protein